MKNSLPWNDQSSVLLGSTQSRIRWRWMETSKVELLVLRAFLMECFVDEK